MSTTHSRESASDGSAVGWRIIGGALVVLIVWLAVGGIGGQYLGKLSGLQKNDTASFLPENADSTRVATALERFSDSTSLPLIVVSERTGGLTEPDRATLNDFAGALPARVLDLDESPTIGSYMTSPTAQVIPSADGQAVMVLVQLDAERVNSLEGETRPLSAIGDTLREAVNDDLRPSGLTSYVTGPGGFISDIANAFAGIDGILLAVAMGVVLVILLVVYRSPVLPFAVLLSAVFGLAAAGFVVYHVANAGLITVSGQSQGILSILVVGAATDYSLLLVARYKEELHDQQSPWKALTTAWRATVEPILASAFTVILGLLCLMLADLKGTSGLGPVGALGIVGALAAALTFLPAVLVLGRRWIFWPAIPHVDHVHSLGTESNTVWGRLARLIEAHPRRVWVLTALALLLSSVFVPTLKSDGISQADVFLTKVESVQGQEVLARHFDAGAGSPLQIIAPEAVAPDVVERLKNVSGVNDPMIGFTPGTPPKVVDSQVLVQATLTDAADSPQAADTVLAVRDAMSEVSSDIVVGGQSAQTLDTRLAADRDMLVVIPAIIIVVLLVLIVLLRSIVAPLILMGANLLSFGATMGISALMFNHIFGFPGGDPTTVLYGFVFLIALGVDYSIFLMTRAREESARVGTKRGVLLALTVTGGVITSAGIVLAATFGALAVLPLLFLAQIAFIVAFGVLIDTLVVRSLLVPALAVELSDRTWWPSKVSATSRPHDAGSAR